METSENDAERIAVLMNGSGLRIDAETIRTRLADENGGVLIAATACVSWALDGGVLHLYDFAIHEKARTAPGEVPSGAEGDSGDLGALVSAANTLANGKFAAVIVATVWLDDLLTRRLLSCGFALDWEEADVRDGRPARLAGLVREVT